MSLGPLGHTSSLSGTSQDAASQLRRSQSNEKSEKAAGLGATDADQETADRDADGRRMWEIQQENPQDEQEAPGEDSQQRGEPPQSKDPTGQVGTSLDLSG